jgi:uncharacterized surface anchored protein
MEERFSEQFNRPGCHKIARSNVISSVTLNSYHQRKTIVMKKIFLASLLMTGVSISALAAEDKGNETGSVQGVVIDAETKKPVANASFTASIRKASYQKEVTTDANGKFNLNNVPVGEHTIVIDKVGYRATKKETILVKEGLLLKIEFEVIPAEEEMHQPFMSPITIHSF